MSWEWPKTAGRNISRYFADTVALWTVNRLTHTITMDDDVVGMPCT